LIIFQHLEEGEVVDLYDDLREIENLFGLKDEGVD